MPEKAKRRAKEVGEGKRGGCYIWIKSLKELLLGGRGNLDIWYVLLFSAWLWDLTGAHIPQPT